MNKERLGNFIGDERKALGLTQKDLAARLHVTDKAVSKWERGLSYPDVTLLEPLASALEMGVEELMACRRQAVKTEKEDETMKALLDISSDSVKAEKRRGWGRLTAILALLLATALGIFYAVTFRSAQDNNEIHLKETVDGVDYIYIEDRTDRGHLLRLKCGEGVDFDAIQLTNERGDLQCYCLTYRWNRRTKQGVVTSCEDTGAFVMDERSTIGSVFGLDHDYQVQDTLFGCSDVSCEIVDSYRNPNGLETLSTYTFWEDDSREGWNPKRRLLTVKDCFNFTQADTDQDGENELVVRTRWPEKPYTVYDLVDGEIVESWPDTVPEEVREKLICVWER